MQPLTSISMAGAGLYILAVLTCIWASSCARESREGSEGYAIWLVAAAFFAVLAIARIWQWEEWLHLWLKEELVTSDAYDGRRAWQRPTAVFVLALGAGLAAWIGRRMYDRSDGKIQPRHLIILSLLGMSVLVALRVVSFHATDRILYGLRLNWVLDPGITLITIGAAIWFIRQSRRSL